MKFGQIGERTGVSHDYYNEYSAKICWLELKGLSEVVDSFKNYPVKRYTKDIL